MATEAKAPNYIPANWRPYANFAGMDRSRDVTALEIPPGTEGAEQPLWLLKHASVSTRGIIEREPLIRRRNDTTTGRVDTAAFYAPRLFCYAAQTGRGVDLLSSRGVGLPDAFSTGTVVSMVAYKGSLYALGGSKSPYYFDGTTWKQSKIPVLPRFGVVLFDRLFAAGFLDDPATVKASRAGNPEIFPDNENPESSEAIKASFINVAEIVGVTDTITGLGSFEGDKIAIFTENNTIVYRVNADFKQWVIDNNATMNIGCVSHRTIVNVGKDLVFCSRYGIHVLSRSRENGLTVMPISLSDRLKDYYRGLVRDTVDKQSISAFYDPDEEKLHIFFPRGDDCIRLTGVMDTDYKRVHWSIGDFNNIRCGASFGGDLVFGCPDGLYTPTNRVIDLSDTFDPQAPSIRGRMEVVTPILWHGNMFEEKLTQSILLHAVGNAEVTVTARDQEGRELTSITLQVEGRDGTEIPSVPLKSEYRIPFNSGYRGVSLTIDTGDDIEGALDIIGYAFELRKKV